jgi:peptidoglycan hydrolase-like protein with peptidoglycan-binding domain
MGTVEGMVAQALSLLARGVGEDPPGSNHNIVTEWYGVDAAWCDMAISYEAGHSDNLDAVCGKFAWTVGHARAFQKRGRWHFGLGGIRRGDVVFFDWSGTRLIDNIDHVGLVEAVNSDGSVTTLEGNTSDRFMRRRRGRDCVVGYGRPSYVDATRLPADDGVLRLGSVGANVRTLQQHLNTVMHAGLAVDAEFGPATEQALRKFQARFGLSVDGEYGPQSAAMMRAALDGRSAMPTPSPVAPAAGSLVVDGDFGPATCAALQRALNAHGAGLTVDGSLGPRTARALQEFLGVIVDGRIGPQTVKALQRRVGAAEDGVWGKDTTRRLQQALNAGTF